MALNGKCRAGNDTLDIVSMTAIQGGNGHGYPSGKLSEAVQVFFDIPFDSGNKHSAFPDNALDPEPKRMRLRPGLVVVAVHFMGGQAAPMLAAILPQRIKAFLKLFQGIDDRGKIPKHGAAKLKLNTGDGFFVKGLHAPYIGKKLLLAGAGFQFQNLVIAAEHEVAFTHGNAGQLPPRVVRLEIIGAGDPVFHLGHRQGSQILPDEISGKMDLGNTLFADSPAVKLDEFHHFIVDGAEARGPTGSGANFKTGVRDTPVSLPAIDQELNVTTDKAEGETAGAATHDVPRMTGQINGL